MSYCRWSSDDFRCDLYCYEDVSGGYTTHVAGNRVLGEIPKTPPWREDHAWVEEYMEAHRRQMAFLNTAERESITLPHAGESFNDPDLPSFLARLLELQGLGYNVPGWVISSVRDEIGEGE